MNELLHDTIETDGAKAAAVEQWTADPCGSSEVDAEIGTAEYFANLDEMRRDYAPWTGEILGYSGTRGMRVLDVGCGQGIDLVRYARAGAIATGIDLTPRHVEIATAHLAAAGLEGTVVQGDAEQLPLDDASFDRQRRPPPPRASRPLCARPTAYSAPAARPGSFSTTSPRCTTGSARCSSAAYS